MLIITTNALSRSDDIAGPFWPGRRVLVVLPNSALDRALIDRLSTQCFVVEWLERPAGAFEVLRSVAIWLKEWLREDDAPLLYLDHPTGLAVDEQIDPVTVAPHEVKGDIGRDGRLHRLVLGEMVATSPLLPVFFQMLDDSTIDDASLVELLTDATAWGSA